MTFCLKTNLSIIPIEVKSELLNLAGSTAYPDFNFLKIRPSLTDAILDNLPECFKFNLDETFFRLQLINQPVRPHVDKGRKSGIYVMLTDNTICTHFYKWKKDAPQSIVDDYISEDQLDRELSVVFPRDEVWLFNHQAIHSVDSTDVLRISLNILYQHTPYTKLVELYQKYRQSI